MPYKRLTIDGTELDLPTDFNPSITYEVSDDGIIMAARAKRSIQLPATTTNDTVFEDWGAIATLNPGATEFKDFTFESGGITLLSGKAQLVSAPLRSDRYRYRAAGYEVDLYGTNADWFLLLKDTRLRDLTYTDKIYNTSSVLAGWYASYAAGDESVFFLAKWKEWATAGQVGIDEFTPGLFIRSIVDKIFDSIGYTLDSDFFDTDVFKKLILPTPLPERYPAEFSQDYINVGLEQPAAYVNSSGTAFLFPNQPITPSVGPNPYNALTGLFTAPYSGYYEIEIIASVVSTIGTWGFNVGASLNSTVVPVFGSTLNFGTAQSGNRSGSSKSNVIYLNAGDTLSLLHVISATDPSTTFEFTMNIIGEADTTFGSIIAFRYLLKDWKVTDFLKGLQHLFNLRFEADTELKRIRIEPADPYLYRERWPVIIPEQLLPGFYTDNLTDLTPNLDLSGESKQYSDTDRPQITVLKYITDGPTDEFVDENQTLGFFAGQYTLPANKFNPATDEKENPFFAKTLSTIDNDLRDASSTLDIQIPLFYPQNYVEDPTATEANYDIQPRILYFAGFRFIDGVINYLFLGSPLTYPYAFMTNYNDPRDFSLSFANEQVNGESVTGLLEAFHLQDFARKRIAKRLEIPYFWDSLSIRALSFRNKMFIDGLQYVLQKIDGYKPLEDSPTKTVLILDQSPEKGFDPDAVSGGAVRGIANLI